MENTIKLYNNKAYGVEVSQYGLENGYLDYQTLARIVGDCILNNYVRAETMEDWEIVHGDLGESEIYQDYIISKQGYKMLAELTDELVFYSERLNMYIWGIAHFGTAWSHVLTDVKIVD